MFLISFLRKKEKTGWGRNLHSVKCPKCKHLAYLFPQKGLSSLCDCGYKWDIIFLRHIVIGIKVNFFNKE